jgi:hypothetical protein
MQLAVPMTQTTEPHETKMKTRTLGALIALVCALGLSALSTARAQGPVHNPPPPPPHMGGGPLFTGTADLPPPPDLTGSDPDLTGSNCPPPDLSGSDSLLSGSGGPPPWISGSDGSVTSGSGAPCGPGGPGGFGNHGGPGGPPDLSGSGVALASGSGAPGCLGGTFGLPTGTSEILTEKITFTPTSGTTTSASALFQAIGISGTDHGSLDIRTKGLISGTYTVTAVTTSGSAAVTLGTFAVKGPTVSGSDVTPISHARSNTCFGGRRGIAFPDGFDPFDITSLAISDSNSNILFSADLTVITDASFDARTPAVTGTSVSGATGYVQLHAVAKAGVVSGFLAISATGLPASTTYTHAINGTDIDTVTTGSGGGLKLFATEGASGTLPSTVDLFTVTSVTVHDSSGNVILSASF